MHAAASASVAPTCTQHKMHGHRIRECYKKYHFDMHPTTIQHMPHVISNTGGPTADTFVLPCAPMSGGGVTEISHTYTVHFVKKAVHGVY